MNLVDIDRQAIVKLVAELDSAGTATYRSLLASSADPLFARKVEITWTQTSPDGSWIWRVWLTGVRPQRSGQPGRRKVYALWSDQHPEGLPDWIDALLVEHAPAGAL